MTDSVVDDRRGWAGVRPNSDGAADRTVAVACFGLACAVGLAFAFVGLDTHSLWFDELFTARLLEPTPGTTPFARIATDVHPPVYLFILSAVTRPVGDGEIGLRLLSAIAACGAVGRRVCCMSRSANRRSGSRPCRPAAARPCRSSRPIIRPDTGPATPR